MGVNRCACCLDVGSGTGIIGQAMQNAGFRDIHALDVSSNFLDAVKKRGFYSEHHNFFLGRGTEQFPSKLKNKFDVVTASGTWMPGHMPNAALDDIHSSLKKDGLMVTAMRMSMWQDGVAEAYKEKILGMVDDGKFEIVKQKTFWRGTEGGQGLFGKQKSILLVLCKRAE